MASPARSRQSTSNGSKRGASSPSVWAFLAVLLMLILLGCSPCQGRKLLAEEPGSKVMHFELEGGLLVLKVSATSSEDAPSTAAAAAPRGFSRAERSMRSVPSPGVGH